MADALNREQSDERADSGGDVVSPESDAAGEPRQEAAVPASTSATATQAQPVETADNLHRMLDVPLDMTVELGRTQMPLAEVLRLDTGSVITIDRLPGEPIDLLINGRVFARGEVVVVKDTVGFRVTELVDQSGNGPGSQMSGG